MKPGRWVQLVAICITLLCVVGSSLLVKPINQERVDLDIVQETRYTDAPKYVILAAAMGTFRGIVVDFLWYRAEKLKNEGKLFEANTTAGWITTLQPRFGQVWVFQSWNMAYNISVITHTPEERWDWVNKGIKLLRDEGIVYNPNNIAIYRQLGWTFFHKIGQRADDMNQYYKAKLAQEWQELLGNPTEGATTDLALKRFKPISDAAERYFPKKVEGTAPQDPFTLLYEDHPKTREVVAKLREFGYDIDQECLRAFGRIVMYSPYHDPRTLYRQDGPLLDERGWKLYELMQDPQYKEGLLQVVNFMRARVLIEDYHMEPQRMYALMVKFGPIDWRHAASQAIYWGATGVEKAGELRDKTKIDVLNTDRQVIHGLQMLMNSGTINFNPMSMRQDTVPDPRFIDSYGKAMVEANERQLNIDWAGTGNTKSFEQGHENFLLRAVLYSYLYGDMEKAQAYYKEIRDAYGQKPHNLNPITGQSKYSVPLRDLIVTEIKADWQMTDQVARPLLESLIIKSLREGLARADYQTFSRQIEIAQKINDELMEDRKYDNPIAPSGSGRLIDWDNFEQLFIDTYVKYMRSPNFDLFERAKVYRNSYPNFRRDSYPRFIEVIRKQEQDMDRGYGDAIDQYFPAPEGLNEEKPEAVNPDAPEDLEGQKTLERK